MIFWLVNLEKKAVLHGENPGGLDWKSCVFGLLFMMFSSVSLPKAFISTKTCSWEPSSKSIILHCSHKIWSFFHPRLHPSRANPQVVKTNKWWIPNLPKGSSKGPVVPSPPDGPTPQLSWAALLRSYGSWNVTSPPISKLSKSSARSEKSRNPPPNKLRIFRDV